MFLSPRHGKEDASSSWRIVKSEFLRKPDAAPKGSKATGRIMFTSVALRLDRGKELEGWMQLHVGGVDGIGS